MNFSLYKIVANLPQLQLFQMGIKCVIKNKIFGFTIMANRTCSRILNHFAIKLIHRLTKFECWTYSIMITLFHSLSIWDIKIFKISNILCLLRWWCVCECVAKAGLTSLETTLTEIHQGAVVNLRTDVVPTNGHTYVHCRVNGIMS